jgi:hypothetical protein
MGDSDGCGRSPLLRLVELGTASGNTAHTTGNADSWPSLIKLEQTILRGLSVR